MNAKDRMEARLALAMLPVGATMTMASAVAFVAVVLLAIDSLVHPPAAKWWLLGWCAVAAGVATVNLRRSIEVMSALDWRPLGWIGILSVAIVAAYPGWWL